MLYIFDMGNVIIDIDFNRVFAVWSKLSGVPLASIKKNFTAGEVFKLHERGNITDIEFAEEINSELGMNLSFEQFAEGWQAIFIAVRPEVIDIMNKLREQGHRVVVLSNTNRLHHDYWPEHYPEIAASADFLYLSQDLGMRKPDPELFKYVLESENVEAQDAIFFDDLQANVDAALSVGMKAVHVVDKNTIIDYFKDYDFSLPVEE
ncbi:MULTISPECIES: glucose-1-phosphatase [Proteus]|uniref:Alpha-D-glucose-1-phosphate phosphatase YihX n=1 Tax=Proteus penneri TaxID=102862 RepID=A0A0G4QG52_9GAMM|nr:MULTISPECIES: glucose-1-phosphatase [Proteus]EEG86471.1 HAD hydrolase, family IA, variant 3 [Proteus penneri ATCC 35198]MBJ2118384.1 glucose-1-phosphatase [Proteus penneri]MCO8051070.1 glucose-1-phosphatase [Proteus penneri]MCX2587809.1 glucose-1-phosphatase [Proteus penneri]NBL77342.1 glucose-1-phosphatase [Proteus sp. G2672]